MTQLQTVTDPDPRTPVPEPSFPTVVAPPESAPETQEEAPADPMDLLGGGAPTPPKVDLAQARSFLTDLRPSGFGELLVTDVWLPPVPKPDKGDGPVDRQKVWAQRQEWRELNLLKERPGASYDARTEHYWRQVREALAQAPDVLADPYTQLVAALGDADFSGLAELRRDAREYGKEADALLSLGRAYLAIGRAKSARNVFRNAVRLEPLHAESWYHLGVASLLSRSQPEASRAFQTALDQCPGDLRMEAALGVALYHERKYEQAEEHFRRTAGTGGLRACSRSMLGCSLRLQNKWDEARVELGFLRDGGSRKWAMVAEQCLDCVARGEQKYDAPALARRRTKELLKSLGATVAGGAWVAYSLAEHLFKGDLRWVGLPVFLVVAVVARSLRAATSKVQPGEFGNYEQGLPCWQATTWMRPRRSEF